MTSVPPGPDYTVNNIARITYDIVTPNGTTSDPAITTIVLGTLSIDKATSPEGTVACGGVITHTITITNTGNADVTVLTGQFTDPIPSQTTYIPDSIIPNNLDISYDNVNNSITNTLPITVPAGSSLVFLYQLSVNC